MNESPISNNSPSTNWQSNALLNIKRLVPINNSFKELLGILSKGMFLQIQVAKLRKRYGYENRIMLELVCSFGGGNITLRFRERLDKVQFDFEGI